MLDLLERKVRTLERIMPNEQTHLFGNAEVNRPSQSPEFNLAGIEAVMSNLFTSENWNAAGTVASSRMDELKHSVQSGDFSIRLLALLGGLALIVSAFFGILGGLASFQISRTLMEVYTIVLGLIILILESRQLHLPDSSMRQLFKYALFLKFVWGRGLLYFIAGSLQFTQGGLISWCVGAYVMVVGILFIAVGRQTADKLSELRKNLYSEHTLRSKFQEVDRSGSGSIDQEQFGLLTENLNLNLNRRQKEAAFLHLDKGDKGRLTFEEFHTWWSEYDDTASSVL